NRCNSTILARGSIFRICPAAVAVLAIPASNTGLLRRADAVGEGVVTEKILDLAARKLEYQIECSLLCRQTRGGVILENKSDYISSSCACDCDDCDAMCDVRFAQSERER